ncbi:hypothetical protein [Acinetobacter thermotolerans]|uniref:hypothetical protein n=1 Tax=Acinetobacter thermotolerans TaxID=3151487 RepID=UPI00325C0430
MEKYPHIILAHSKKGERLILSNVKGGLTYHWEYTPFTHHRLNQVWDLELLKSKLLNNKANIDWAGYQWVLNKFDELNRDYRSPADVISQNFKEALEAAANGIRKFAEAWSAFGYKGKR